MRIRSLIFLAMLSAFVTPAQAVEEKPYTVTANTVGFDTTTNLYNFAIRFKGISCPNVSYDITLTSGPVKDSQEAFAKVDPQIRKFIEDLDQEKKHCSDRH